MSHSDQFNPQKSLAKAALIPSTIVALLSILISLLVSKIFSKQISAHHISGSSIFWGAVIASILVLIFFGISMIIGLIADKVDPNVTMLLAMFSFFFKLIFLGVGLALIGKLTQPTSINRTSFLVTALGLIFTWLVGEIVGFLKLKFQLPLPQADK